MPSSLVTKFHPYMHEYITMQFTFFISGYCAASNCTCLDLYYDIECEGLRCVTLFSSHKLNKTHTP